MSTHNSKPFILYIYFKGAPTSPFEAYFVNNNLECKEERKNNHKIVTIA